MNQLGTSYANPDRSVRTPPKRPRGCASLAQAEPVKTVLLQLLGNAPPRQPAVSGASGDVAVILGQKARKYSRSTWPMSVSVSSGSLWSILIKPPEFRRDKRGARLSANSPGG